MRALVILALVTSAIACGDDDTSTDSGPADTGIHVDTGTLADAGALMDTGAPADAGPITCSFNRECPESMRCFCTEEAGCFCETGARGSGQNGIDTCVSQNDCASSLCVEGEGGTFYCSDECTTNDNCQAALPECVDIAFVGRICVRTAL